MTTIEKQEERNMAEEKRRLKRLLNQNLLDFSFGLS